MLELYRKAARQTAPKVAGRTPADCLGGRWISERSYFFVGEEIASDGRIRPLPFVVDRETGCIEPAISRSALDELIGSQCSSGGSTDELMFEMPDEDHLVVSTAGVAMVVSRRDGRCLRSSRLPETGGVRAPDGTSWCVHRGPDLVLVDPMTGGTRQLTADGAVLSSYGRNAGGSWARTGQADGPVRGIWSPDGTWFLTHRVDEQTVPEHTLAGCADAATGDRVARRGEPQALFVPVAIHTASGRELVFEDATSPAALFSPFATGAAWFDDLGGAWWLSQDRYFRSLRLVSLDLERGGSSVLLEEKAELWIDPHPLVTGRPNVRMLAASGGLIWPSECSGWNHLYLHDLATGERRHAITAGEWQVHEILHVDEAAQTLIFLASGLHPGEDRSWRSLCRVGLDGSDFAILDSHLGDLDAAPGLPGFRPGEFGHLSHPSVSPDGGAIMCRHMSSVDGESLHLVDRARRVRLAHARAPVPSLPERHCFVATAADGETAIHGNLYLPDRNTSPAPWPLVVQIYPGSHLPSVTQSGADIRDWHAKCLAELGIASCIVDTRGTPHGSRAFRTAAAGTLVEPQLADHASAVRQLLAQHPTLDSDRIGIVGESAGGFAVVRALADYDLFRVGVAIAGSHDSGGCTSWFTDKFVGPDAPVPTSAEVAAKIKAPLLLVHGGCDTAVPADQSRELAKVLRECGHATELLIVPEAAHDIWHSCPAAVTAIWDFLVRHLLDREPPLDFDLDFTAEELARSARRRWAEVVR